jgi:outer membrane protein
MLALLFLLLAHAAQSPPPDARQAPLAPVSPTPIPAGSALQQPLPDAPLPPAPEGPVLSLPDALEAARKQAPDLAVAAERVQQARNNVDRAWAAVKPTLTGLASATYNNLPGFNFAAPGQPGDRLTEAASLNFGWTFFNGRAFPALATAKQGVEVARLTETQQRREILLQVASIYFSGLGLRELANVAFRQSAVNRQHAAEAQARFEAGLIQRSAALRARIDVVRADEEARRALFSYAASKSQLAALLDRPDTAFELLQPQKAPKEIRGTFQALLQRAMIDRPELAAARANEEIAARLRTDAWAQFLPSLALNAAARLNNPSQAVNGDHGTWAVTLALTLPLYDGGFRYVALKDAQSQLRQAKAQTRGTTALVADELRRAQIDLESAKALREEAEQALGLSRENEELVRAQFAAGTATQVEVSDAEAALFQSEATALQQRLQVQLSALRVAKAVGAFDSDIDPDSASERVTK